MKILLLTGIKEELGPLLGYYSFNYDKSARAWKSLAYPELFATTTGPGLAKKKELKKLLKYVQPEVIINAGLAGVLEDECDLQIGERASIKMIWDSNYRIVYPGSKGKNTLVSVKSPVFSPGEKMDVALEYNAQLCDMEASKLIGLLGQFDDLQTTPDIVFCKVVGDRPENYDLFRYEYLVRDWHHSSLARKIITGLRFPGGPWRLKRLLDTKKNALHSLCHHVNKLIQNLIDHQGIYNKIDSTFLLH